MGNLIAGGVAGGVSVADRARRLDARADTGEYRPSAGAVWIREGM